MPREQDEIQLLKQKNTFKLMQQMIYFFLVGERTREGRPIPFRVLEERASQIFIDMLILDKTSFDYTRHVDYFIKSFSSALPEVSSEVSDRCSHNLGLTLEQLRSPSQQVPQPFVLTPTEQKLDLAVEATEKELEQEVLKLYKLYKSSNPFNKLYLSGSCKKIKELLKKEAELNRQVDPLKKVSLPILEVHAPKDILLYHGCFFLSGTEFAYPIWENRPKLDAKQNITSKTLYRREHLLEYQVKLLYLSQTKFETQLLALPAKGFLDSQWLVQVLALIEQSEIIDKQCQRICSLHHEISTLRGQLPEWFADRTTDADFTKCATEARRLLFRFGSMLPEGSRPYSLDLFADSALAAAPPKKETKAAEPESVSSFAAIVPALTEASPPPLTSPEPAAAPSIPLPEGSVAPTSESSASAAPTRTASTPALTEEVPDQTPSDGAAPAPIW